MYNIPIYLWLLDTYHPILLSLLVMWLLKACGSKWEDLPSSLLELIQVMTVMFREGLCSVLHPIISTSFPLYLKTGPSMTYMQGVPREFLYSFGYLSLIPVVLPAVLTHQVVHTLPQVPTFQTPVVRDDTISKDTIGASLSSQWQTEMADGGNASYLGRIQCLETKKDHNRSLETRRNGHPFR